MANVLVSYIPALHAGYLRLLTQYPQEVYVLGRDLVLEHPRMERDIRAVDPKQMVKAIQALGICKSVEFLEKKNLKKFLSTKAKIFMPDEDLSHTIAEKYFKTKKITFVPVFLRWDRVITLKEHEVSPDRIISTSERDRKLMKSVTKEGSKSPDWWRQNGVLIVKNGKVIISCYNRHLPHNQVLDIMGDPRSNFDAGEHLDIYTSIHAEAAAIAEAARKGISLLGTSMYMTTFPCSVCARSIIEAGIKKIYYLKGYSRLDAEDLLKKKGVEIVLVKEK